MRVAFRAEPFNFGLLGKFSFDGFDFFLRSQSEFGEQICRRGHAGHDLNVNLSFVHENLPDTVVIVRPAEFESVGLLVPRLAFGRKRQAGVRLSPPGSVFPGHRARRSRVNIDAVSTATAAETALVVPIFELRVFGRNQSEKRRGAVGAHPKQKRTVTGNKTVLEDDGTSSASLPAGTTALAAASGDGKRHRQVANLDRLITGVFEIERPEDGPLLKVETHLKNERGGLAVGDLIGGIVLGAIGAEGKSCCVDRKRRIDGLPVAFALAVLDKRVAKPSSLRDEFRFVAIVRLSQTDHCAGIQFYLKLP